MNPDVIVRAIEGNIENDDEKTLGERKREIRMNEREATKYRLVCFDIQPIYIYINNNNINVKGHLLWAVIIISPR